MAGSPFAKIVLVTRTGIRMFLEIMWMIQFKAANQMTESNGCSMCGSHSAAAKQALIQYKSLANRVTANGLTLRGVTV